MFLCTAAEVVQTAVFQSIAAVGFDADIGALAVGLGDIAEVVGHGLAAYGKLCAVHVAAVNTADTAHAATGVVVVGQLGVTTFVIAHDGADCRTGGSDGSARVEAVLDGAAVVVAHYAADELRTADGGGTGAAPNGAGIQIAGNGADIVCCTVDGDVTGYMAVLDGSAISTAYDAADWVITNDGAVGECQVLDGPRFYETKETRAKAAWLVDVDAADFVALAVEVAREPMIIISYGREVVLRPVVGDVGTQFEVFACIDIAAVHVAGEQVETGGVADDEGVFLCAVAAPWVGAIELAVVGLAILVNGDALVVGTGGVGADRCAYSGVGCRIFVGEGGAVGVGAVNTAYAATGIEVVGQRGSIRTVFANYGAHSITKIAADSTGKEVVFQRGGFS